MDPVGHGGRALAFARERNIDYRDVLDFSANINPLGPSPLALAALRDSLDIVRIYPEETARRLTARLSLELGISADKILAGNGATDLLYFWLRTIGARTATLVVPTFSEYRKALRAIGIQIQTLTLHSEDHFRLPAIRPSTDLLIVTNPNNPTAEYAPPEVLTEWIAQIPATTQILLDEAFVEFAGQPSMVRYADRFPNLWVLRSMTKFYAIPGLRLGYLVGQGVPSILPFREPWQVNNLAEVAGIASLDDRAHAEATLELLYRERAWLWSELQGLPHVQAFPSNANFFLAQCDSSRRLDELIATLANDNILIRDCRDVEGLTGSWFRFAIKDRPENNRLLEYLRRI